MISPPPPTSSDKQTLDDIRQEHISKYSTDHWEKIVGEEALRTCYMDYNGMSRELMDGLVARVADARLNEYAGFQGENLDYEILSPVAHHNDMSSVGKW